MSTAKTQLISSLIVAVGVGLCATFGAQLTPKTLEAITQELSVSQKDKNKHTSPSVEEPLARVLTWWSKAGEPFSGGLLLIFFGSFMARAAKKSSLSQSGDETSDKGTQQLNHTLNEMISQLEAILSEDRTLSEIKGVIEEVQRDHLTPLIEARELTRVQIGTSAFIEVFGPIAQGERKLNRAWAACVDHHKAEAIQSISHALEAFQTSLSLSV